MGTLVQCRTYIIEQEYPKVSFIFVTVSGRGHVSHLPPVARIVDEGLLAGATAAGPSSHEEEVSPSSSFAQRDKAMAVEGKWE